MATPTSPYGDYALFKKRWGTKAITNASNTDGTAGAIDEEAVQESFSWADGQINDGLAGGVIAVPLDHSAWGETGNPTVRNWHHILAYSHLYENRGFNEKARIAQRLEKAVKAVRQEMALVKAGLQRLEAAPNADLEVSYVTHEDVLDDRRSNVLNICSETLMVF